MKKYFHFSNHQKTKCYLLFLLLSLSCLSLNAQVFWTETFDGASCVAGSGCSPSLVSWTVISTGTNGGTANEWYVSDAENGNAPPACGSAAGGDQSLHVGNVSTSSAAFLFCPSGDCGSAYDDSGAGEATDKRAESPTIDCSGKSDICVNFNYLENGNGNLDNATFWYFDGSTWTLLDNLIKSATGCAPQGQWTAIPTIYLPASANNNPNVKIGFRWVNDGDGVASDPSFAVDDISLTSNCTALPIELIKFTAQQNEGKVILEWETASELNCDYFSVEKSKNGYEWFEVNLVNGAGTSNTVNNYKTVDDRPFSALSYYRLKQTDFNGHFDYSNIVSIDFQFNNAEFIYPQPAKEKFTLVSSKKYKNISFWNVLGKRIELTKTVQPEGIVFDVSTLPKGIYFLHLLDDKGKKIQKIVVE